jgi:hypothetical protein
VGRDFSGMAPTIAIRVLDELRHSSLALDDDELALRLAVSPRQTINQVCRRLERAGRLHRRLGPNGKIVNDLRRAEEWQAHPPKAEQVDVSAVSVSDSRVQREAEPLMLALLGERLGVELTPRRVDLGDGVRVEVDGVDADRTVLVEAWAHQGKVRSAQRHKVLADVLKLRHVASRLPVEPRLVLCFSDPEAAQPFTAVRSWAAQAIRDSAIEVEVVELPADVRAAIREAQRRQFR